MFIEEPKSQSVIPGATVNFICTAKSRVRLFLHFNTIWYFTFRQIWGLSSCGKQPKQFAVLDIFEPHTGPSIHACVDTSGQRQAPRPRYGLQWHPHHPERSARRRRGLRLHRLQHVRHGRGHRRPLCPRFVTGIALLVKIPHTSPVSLSSCAWQLHVLSLVSGGVCFVVVFFPCLLIFWKVSAVCATAWLIFFFRFLSLWPSRNDFLALDLDVIFVCAFAN